MKAPNQKGINVCRIILHNYEISSSLSNCHLSTHTTLARIPLSIFVSILQLEKLRFREGQ